MELANACVGYNIHKRSTFPSHLVITSAIKINNTLAKYSSIKHVFLNIEML